MNVRSSVCVLGSLALGFAIVMASTANAQLVFSTSAAQVGGLNFYGNDNGADLVGGSQLSLGNSSLTNGVGNGLVIHNGALSGTNSTVWFQYNAADPSTRVYGLQAVQTAIADAADPVNSGGYQYNAYDWTGGINITSVPGAAINQNNPNVNAGIMGIGYASVAELEGEYGRVITSWRGTPVGPNDIVVGYDYTGDALMSGTVDLNSLGAWQNTYIYGLPSYSALYPSPDWATGDFNGDGSVDLNDLGIWQNASIYNSTPQLFIPTQFGASLSLATASPSLALGGPTTVPEPSTFLLLTIFAALSAGTGALVACSIVADLSPRVLGQQSLTKPGLLLTTKY